MNATKKSFVIAFLKIFVTFWLNFRLADKLQEEYREILSRVTVYLACLYPHLTLITNEGSSSGCHLPEGTWLTRSFTPGLLFFPNWLSSPPICFCLTGLASHIAQPPAAPGLLLAPYLCGVRFPHRHYSSLVKFCLFLADWIISLSVAATSAPGSITSSNNTASLCTQS